MLEHSNCAWKVVRLAIENRRQTQYFSDFFHFFIDQIFLRIVAFSSSSSAATATGNRETETQSKAYFLNHFLSKSYNQQKTTQIYKHL